MLCNDWTLRCLALEQLAHTEFDMPDTCITLSASRLEKLMCNENGQGLTLLRSSGDDFCTSAVNKQL